MKKLLISVLVLIVTLCSFVFAFSDVFEEHWAYKTIQEMQKEGYINGYEDGTFRPENMVTYGEFMKLVVHKYVPEKNIIKNLSAFAP